MKSTFTSHEIAHIWAHRSAPHGKAPANMHFSGDTFYSYNTAIARHISHKGKAAVILNTTHYSVSTSSHQSYVRQALPDSIPVFRVDGEGRGSYLSFTGKQLFAHYIEKARAAETAARQARMQKTKDAQHALAGMHLEQAKAVSAFFGLRRKVDEKAVERFAVAKQRAEKQAAKRQAEHDRQYRVDMQAEYESWLRNEPSRYFQASLFPVAFRIEGDELVSTLGARVPLAAAKLAYRFAMRHRHDNWRENGETCTVGNYRLNAISKHGIVAGCHRITWSELERLAPVLA